MGNRPRRHRTRKPKPSRSATPATASAASSDPASAPIDAGTAVERFRERTGGGSRRRGRFKKQAVLPFREKLIAGGLFLQLALLAFWLGGWNLEPNLAAAFLGLGVFLLLFVPFGARYENPDARVPSANLKRLLRFPVFWTGYLFLLYILIQALNPGWELRYYGSYSVVHRLDSIAWLPSGLNAPLEESNPFRLFLLFVCAWFFVCTLWAGIQSRRVLTGLMVATSALSASWIAVSLYQFYTNADKILGIWTSVRSQLSYKVAFWGTLVNDNHAAYFMVLCTALFMGLFLHFLRENLLRLRMVGPFVFFLFGAVLGTFQVLLTQSRGGITAILLLWVLFLIVSFAVVLRHSRKIAVAFLIPFPAAVVILGYFAASNPTIWQQIEKNIEHTELLIQDPRNESRFHVTPMTWNMFKRAPWLGTGGGSFRYFFKYERRNHPEFQPYGGLRIWDDEAGRYRWIRYDIQFRQAHNDWVEFLYEFGIVGYSLLVFCIAFFPILALRHAIAWDGLYVMLTGGAGLVLLAAFIGFHFRMPLIHLYFAFLLVGATKWVVLRAQRKSG